MRVPQRLHGAQLSSGVTKGAPRCLPFSSPERCRLFASRRHASVNRGHVQCLLLQPAPTLTSRVSATGAKLAVDTFTSPLLTAPGVERAVWTLASREWSPASAMGGDGHGHGFDTRSVWSPSGGWYPDPRGWRRNTALAMGAIAVASYFIASASAKLEVRAVAGLRHRVGLPNSPKPGDSARRVGRALCRRQWAGGLVPRVWWETATEGGLQPGRHGLRLACRVYAAPHTVRSLAPCAAPPPPVADTVAGACAAHSLAAVESQLPCRGKAVTGSSSGGSSAGLLEPATAGAAQGAGGSRVAHVAASCSSLN